MYKAAVERIRKRNTVQSLVRHHDHGVLSETTVELLQLSASYTEITGTELEHTET